MHLTSALDFPLNTDDAFWCCLTLATCYQLAQFVLKIVLNKKVDRGRWAGIFMTCYARGGCLEWL